MVQIREKALQAKQLLKLSSDAAKITSGTETQLLINGRADIAIAAGADGVHLPEDGLPIDVLRGKFARPFIIGASVHSVEAAISAKNEGSDFAVFGPVFETPGKGGTQGLDKLRLVCDSVPGLPVIAVGGIDRSNFRKVFEFGASGFAAIRFLNDHQVLSDFENGILSANL